MVSFSYAGDIAALTQTSKEPIVAKLLHLALASTVSSIAFAMADAGSGAGGPTSVSLKILDTEGFNVTLPYLAGHTINEAEAKVLNQTRKENLGNNFRPKVRAYEDAIAEGKDPEVSLDQLIADFAKLDADYVFTLANAAASVKLTPEEREARSIAKEYVKMQLEAQGLKVNTPPEGHTEESWKDTLEANYEAIADSEEVKKIAAETVKKRAAAKKLALPGLNLEKTAA